MAGFRHLRCAGGALARITLDRPPLNVLTIELLRELAAAAAEIGGRGEAKVVAVESANPRAFSAGVDVADHLDGREAAMLEAMRAALTAIGTIEVPTVAFVRGHCLGGGLELALACDLIFAGESASFGQPELRLGVFAPFSSVLLPRRLGPQRAASLCLLGEPIGAATALGWGLAQRLLGEEDFAAALALAPLLALPRQVLVRAKRALRLGAQAAAGDLGQGLALLERFYLDSVRGSAEAEEGLRAFLEKRPPRWS